MLFACSGWGRGGGLRRRDGALGASRGGSRKRGVGGTAGCGLAPAAAAPAKRTTFPHVLPLPVPTAPPPFSPLPLPLTPVRRPHAYAIRPDPYQRLPFTACPPPLCALRLQARLVQPAPRRRQQQLPTAVAAAAASRRAGPRPTRQHRAQPPPQPLPRPLWWCTWRWRGATSRRCGRCGVATRRACRPWPSSTGPGSPVGGRPAGRAGEGGRGDHMTVWLLSASRGGGGRGRGGEGTGVGA